MAQRSTDDLKRLQEALARPERIGDAMALAGGALAVPLMTLRSRQAEMEAARAELRHGADHPETRARQAQARSLAGREQHMRSEVERRTLRRPDIGDAAGLFGRVTRDGEPVSGAAVNALDDRDNRLAHGCTGNDGGYSIAFAPDSPVRIEVRDATGPVFRDDKGVPYPPYRATHRDIDLSQGRPICPDGDGDGPDDNGGGPEDPEPDLPDRETQRETRVPNVVDRLEAQAGKILSDSGLRVGKVARSRSQVRAGLVTSQQPAAGAVVASDTAVDLAVSAGGEEVPDVCGQPLHRAIQSVVKAGVEIGAVSVSIGAGIKVAKVEAAEPDAEGRVDLHVSVASGDAPMTGVMASVLAATPEAAEMSLSGKAQTADWLKQRDLTNRGKVGEALDMDDDTLRDRLSLDPLDPIGTVRSLLRAAIDRIREI
jgi:hypothetical protein